MAEMLMKRPSPGLKIQSTFNVYPLLHDTGFLFLCDPLGRVIAIEENPNEVDKLMKSNERFWNDEGQLYFKGFFRYENGKMCLLLMGKRNG